MSRRLSDSTDRTQTLQLFFYLKFRCDFIGRSTPKENMGKGGNDNQLNHQLWEETQAPPIMVTFFAFDSCQGALLVAL